ncbi:hypothetical protein ACF090_01215 [Streptomyces sp. NPDC014892]|uniref:hypothetical protein n=1 Tax=Streptomyces sp. NPDC014892 TaxID=3364930 RepID=UPI0036FE5A91
MKPQTLISVSATVIALASLWVSFTESRSIRSHNRQSVRPLLQIRRVLNFEGTRTGIQLVNAGLGPAIVTTTIVRLLFSDDFERDAHAWFWALVSERLMIEIFYESMYGGENFRAVLIPPWETPA